MFSFTSSLLHVLSFSFRTGDIAMLQVEAVVNPTNESLSDKNPISLRLYEVAGPELREECKTQVGSELIGCIPSPANLSVNTFHGIIERVVV